MFGRFMNNYYYGKSGKGDFRQEDLPATRMQLFRDTLRTRLASLCRLNLIYMLFFLPAIIVMILFYTQFLTTTTNLVAIGESDYETYTEALKENGTEFIITEEEFNKIKNSDIRFNDVLDNYLFRMLLWLIPCLAITGPFTAGVCYVTRNWARDEHAFIWSDFKDAVKANWKQSLVLSVITSLMPIIVYVGWKYYGQLAENNMIMLVPQVLIALVALIWTISVTYMYPIAVTYDLKIKDVIRNGLILGVARLPMSVGIRLLLCVPAAICAALCYFWSPWYGMLILVGWYVLIGFALSRFITASYTNAVFDRFINPRIEGAKVGQGLRKPEEDEDVDDAEDAGEGDATD